MKYTFTFFVLGLLLLTSCGSRDERLSKKLIGTWTTDDGSEVWIVSENGSFDARWTKVVEDIKRSYVFQGIWEVRDGALVETITNRSSIGFTNIAPVGTVVRSHICRLNSAQMTLEMDGQTNHWERKP